jgi:hypothetical protein
MKHQIGRPVKRIAILSALLLVGCSSPGGVMQAGKISPCPDFRTDAQACGNALFNAPRLPKISAGMTTAEVRSVMQHDAERREIAGNTETWLYMSDYEAEQMTAIVFTDGKVTAMKQVPWKAKE